MLLHKPLTCQLLLVDTKKYGDRLFWTQIQQKCEDPDRIKNTSKVKEKAWQITVFRWCDCGLRQVHHPADQRVPRHLQVSWWFTSGVAFTKYTLKSLQTKKELFVINLKNRKINLWTLAIDNCMIFDKKSSCTNIYYFLNVFRFFPEQSNSRIWNRVNPNKSGMPATTKWGACCILNSN